MDLTQLDKFMKQLNQMRNCATPGCKGELTPVHVKSAGLGGAVSIGYTCNGCVSQTTLLETSAKYELTSISEISIAVQVAFIVVGCTYYKTLKPALGIDAVEWHQFQSTIALLWLIQCVRKQSKK